MAYSSGGQVNASDYNTLVSNIDNVFGTGTGNFGYGGNSTNVALDDLVSVGASSTIEAIDWKNLRNAFSDMSLHQGVSLPDVLPSLSLLDVGDLITFFSQLESSDNIDSVNDNRLTVDAPTNLTLATKLTSVRSTSWMSMIQHEFTVDFSDEDDARHFFNTGGEIRISASRTGGSATAQNAAWSSLVSSNSPFIFLGYADYISLTGSFSPLASFPSGGAYIANIWNIFARRENFIGSLGGNGSTIRFRLDFIDGYSSIPDSVDGTFTSTIEERRSVGVFVRPSPIFTTTIPLTMGS